MAKSLKCPGCQKTLRIPEDKLGRTLKCPGCGQAIRTKKPKPVEDTFDDSEFDDLVSNDDEVPAMPSAKARRTATSKSVSNKSFYKKYIIALCSAMGVVVLIGLGGFASETVAMIATGLVVALMLACVVGGRTWMAIDLGREKLWLGFAAFLIPIVGIALSFRNRGPSLRGAVVMMSTLAPALLGLGMTATYKSMYTAAGKGASRASSAAERIHRADESLTPDSPTRTATYTVTGRPESIDALVNDADSLLSEFESYEVGSFTFDESTRTASLRYRGNPANRLGYGLFLGGKTKAFVRFNFPESESASAPAP